MSQAQEAPARATEDGPQRDMPATAVDVPETADQTPVDDAALDLEAAPSLTRELTREQVELETRGDMRDYATGIVMAVATVNMGCMLILQPMHPMMCSNARGATRPGGWDPAYTHPQAFPASGYPSAFSYTWAVSTILVVNFLGAAISEVTMGTLSDRYGRKPALLVGTGLGACTLVGYYVAGVVLQSYWAYLAFQFVNGLSGGIKTVVQSYIQVPGRCVPLPPIPRPIALLVLWKWRLGNHVTTGAFLMQWSLLASSQGAGKEHPYQSNTIPPPPLVIPPPCNVQRRGHSGVVPSGPPRLRGL